MTQNSLIVGLAVLVAATAPVAAQHPARGCLSYEPDTVSLRGTLRRHTFPGPPNYESVKEGDEPETGFYLHLLRPVCTVAEDINDAHDNVRLVQLVLDSTGYARLTPALGHVITIRGTLSSAITGHQHALLQLEVLTPVRYQ
jgi:hypothetical protein